MDTGVFVFVVVLNVALAVICTWQIEERFPKYYEETGLPTMVCLDSECSCSCLDTFSSFGICHTLRESFDLV